MLRRNKNVPVLRKSYQYKFCKLHIFLLNNKSTHMCTFTFSLSKDKYVWFSPYSRKMISHSESNQNYLTLGFRKGRNSHIFYYVNAREQGMSCES